MGKVVEKVKAAVKKVTTKKETVKEVVKKVPVTCEDCGGTGLIDRENLCVLCDGSGQK